jgi:2-aminoethylphosphonate-pyruvate transaminase
VPLPKRSQVLFNPGPVNLDDRIKENLFNLELCHRQPEFADLAAAVEAKLRQALGFPPDRHALALLPGGGSLAVDAALATFVGSRAMVLGNGIYAERLADVLGVAGVECTARIGGPGSRLDLDAAGAELDRTHHDWVAMVHHETSTGMLNPLGAVADLAERHGCRLYVDAVSSAGAHPLDPRCDVVSFNSAKCLESLPGIAGVLFSRALEGRTVTPALDVVRYSEGIPTTPNVHAYIALDVALDVLLEEDRPGRYRRLANRVWQAGSRDFEPYLPEEDRSHVLTAFHLGGRDPDALFESALAHDYVIYPGQGSLREQIFRVANMGAAIDETTIDDLFEVLAR